MSPTETVRWTDGVDEVLGGDLTAALAYVTPARGVVLAAVAPIGLRDRVGGHRRRSRPPSASAASSTA